MQVAVSDLGCDPITIQTGIVAKQANGAVLVSQGETVILATATASREAKEGADFLPLTVDYREPSYAAGKIPGGFFKRPGRPNTKETLSSRLTDRPLRPLFPEGFTHEVQVLLSVLSFDQRNSPELLAVIGASAALHISDIPFNGPVGCVRVGLIDGKLVIDPDLEARTKSDLELVVAGTARGVCMVECRAKHLSEDLVADAIAFGQEAVKKICVIQNELRDKGGKPKFTIEPVKVPDGLVEKIQKLAGDKILAAVTTKDKLAGREAMHQLHLGLKEKLASELGAGTLTMGQVHQAVEAIVERDVRRMILDDGRRYDGRSFKDIRPIHCAVSILPRTHGSGLFTRGETQALAVTTLGITEDEQVIDGLEDEYRERFLLHYSFPPYSVGETRPLRGTSRREIGHGELAKKALEGVMPDKDRFPYTVRVVSEILESNGSSSMATVCAGTLAMMDAGIPLSEPISGVAMGLVKQGDKYAVLSDIAGPEDHFGDMDFKVAGSTKGITALQMDIKIEDVSVQIMKEALLQAREGRLHILQKMAEALATPRTDISKYAPRILTIPVPNERIGMIIGPGGKTIRHMVEVTGCKIESDDERNVVAIVSTDEAKAQQAREMILRIIEDPEVGKIYQGKVVKITNFGAFVEILPAHEGLVHISQLDHRRVNRVEDICSVGDVLPVKLTHIDDQGRLSLSRKDALRDTGQGGPVAEPAAGEAEGEAGRERDSRDSREGRYEARGRGRHDRGRGRDGRGRDRDRDRGPDRDRDRDRGPDRDRDRERPPDLDRSAERAEPSDRAETAERPVEHAPEERAPLDRAYEPERPEEYDRGAPRSRGYDRDRGDREAPVPGRSSSPVNQVSAMAPENNYDDDEPEEGEPYESDADGPRSRGDYYEEETFEEEEPQQQPPPPAPRHDGGRYYPPARQPGRDRHERHDRPRTGPAYPAHGGMRPAHGSSTIHPPPGGHPHERGYGRSSGGGRGDSRGGYSSGRDHGPHGGGGGRSHGHGPTRRRHS
ncbi:MAG: polyribonucleotide nucleotidyltransferase [Candidatus Riflebacteria bacterium]|nr:polyribonucleotide nucleotidyltransferase [Candidatus Riflebacteria bacterium]